MNKEQTLLGKVHTEKEPLVSILIPAYECWELTRDCVASIRDKTLVDYEIILVDDASSRETAEKLSSLAGPDLRILRNDTRRSFSHNHNRAAKEARGKYLCMHNNDTLVTAGWLRPMVDILEANPDIGVLGNRHLFPENDFLHHCGMAFNGDGHPWHIHPHTDPERPAASFQRDFQIVTFACVLIPAGVFRNLGGLDESYRNGYEDCDFCLRAREAGYRVTYTPASTIYHYGQASPGRKDSDDINRDRFLKRWRGRIEPDMERILAEDKEYEKRRTSVPRRVKRGEKGLHIAADLSRGSAFTWAFVELILALDDLSERISLPKGRLDKSIEKEKARRLRRLMRKDPYRSYHVKWTHYWAPYLKQELSGEINAEIYCTNYRYGKDSPHLDLWTRHVQLNDFRKLPVSAYNLEALMDIGIPRERCAVVPLGYAPEIIDLFPDGPPQKEPDGHLKIMVVTNSHDLYRYGTDIAVRALARAFGPDDPVVVHIKDYGASSGNRQLEEWISAEKNFPPVVWHREFISKKELMRLYSQADVLLTPFRGEGFGMKILDAMAIGVPVMMPDYGGPSEYAAEGTFWPLPYREVPVGPCFDRQNYFLGDDVFWCEVDADGLAVELRRLAAGRAELQEIGRRALEYVRVRYSWPEAARKLMKALVGWEQERLAVVSPGRGPDEKALSVIIPTKDREDTLAKALEAYGKQTLPREDYEIILVNDGGRRRPLEDLMDLHSSTMDIKLQENTGSPGPAAARNCGIRSARGEVVLITGDDIIPAPEFLERHRRGHQRHAHLETALLGLTLWHQDLDVTPFMKHIVEEGGHQFNYKEMKDGRPIPFDRFYTSNVSLKRAFLIENEELFSTHFRYAAYEDVELAWRLHLQGMELRFLESAVGYHDHPTSPRSFVERQRKVGRMLALMAMQRPAFVPPEHTVFLHSLEYARRQNWPVPEYLGNVDLTGIASELAETFGLLMKLEEDLGRGGSAQMGSGEGEGWRKFFEEASLPLWEGTNEMILRIGMAEEWAGSEEDLRWARNWVVLLSLPKIIRPGPTRIISPSARAHYDYQDALFPESLTVYLISYYLRKMPLLGSLVRAAEKSSVGRRLRQLLLNALKKE